MLTVGVILKLNTLTIYNLTAVLSPTILIPWLIKFGLLYSRDNSAWYKWQFKVIVCYEQQAETLQMVSACWRNFL